MRVVHLECERCGASLSVKPDGDVVRCRYCGAEVLVGPGAARAVPGPGRTVIWLTATLFAALVAVAVAIVLARRSSSCDSADHCLELGGSLEETDAPAAETAYARACTLGDARGCYSQGVLALRRHDRAKALGLFEKACRDGHAAACANAGALTEDAAQKRALGERACNLGAALGCGNVAAELTRAGDFAGAVTFAKRGCDAGSVTGCAAWVDALLNTNEPKKALEAAQRGTEIDANNPAALWELGNALAVAGESDQAVAALRKAVEQSRTLANVKQGEMPTYDEPLPLSIKRDLTNLVAKYPASRQALNDVLGRMTEWSRAP